MNAVRPVLVAGLLVGLAACGSGPSAGPSSTGATVAVPISSSVVTATTVRTVVSSVPPASGSPTSAPPVTSGPSNPASAPVPSTLPSAGVTTTRLTPTTPVTRQIAAFRMPSNNIGCAFGTDAGGPYVSCVIAEVADTVFSAVGLRSPCGSMQAWSHRIVFHRQKFDYPCGARAALPAGPVLDYGQVVTGGLLSCRSSEAGLTCASPIDETGFALSRTTLSINSGEGGGAVVEFPSGTTHAAVTGPGERTWFQSHDRTVTCAAVNRSIDSHVYCVPSHGSFPTPPNALGCTTGAEPIAVLDEFSAHTAVSVACGGPRGADGVRANDDTAVAAATFPSGGVVTIGTMTCTIGSSSISCLGSNGTGFGLSATSYRPLT